MALPTGAVGVAFLATGVALLFLLREPLRHPENPGSRGFALAVIGISIWPASHGVNYFLAGLEVSITLWNVRLFAASLISVGWFLLAVDVTGTRSPSRRLLAPLAGYLALDQAFAWSNPAHHLVLGPGTAVDGTILSTVFGPWFWAQTVVNYGLIVVGTVLLVAEWATSSGLRRRQHAVLALAVVPPVAANLATIFDPISTSHDLTPFGLVGSGLLLSWALYRASFLDVVPVARQTAMAGMHDAVVTVDDRNRVVDCNRTARTLFDVTDSYVGTPAGSFFDPIAADVLDRFVDANDAETTDADDADDEDGTDADDADDEDGTDADDADDEDGTDANDADDAEATDANADDVDAEIATTIDGERRHFSVSVSPVRRADETVARVIVLRDITRIKRRERELEVREAQLDVLRQVLTRVLRHDVRNELTVIQGNGQELAETLDNPLDRRAAAIVEAGDELLDIGETAREIERIVDRDDETATYDLSRVAERAVEVVGRQYPDVTFGVAGPDSRSISTGPGLEAAVENLVENAAAYNDADDPRVRVSIDDAPDGPTLTVADNGPGIPDAEIAVLSREAETALSHASGLGLWLVKWVADRSGADLAFETGDDGTTVSIRFAGDPPATP